MCGIVGYVGKRQAYPILIKGLHRLEYRGYDSAGLALVNREGVLNVFKSKGKVADLEHFVESKDLDGTIGIAHTRWATHGEPNDINAHPHYSDSGNIALIHNGIIENYRVLKEALIENGYTFKSDTDTEVLVNLIEYIRTSNNCTLLEAVQQALKQVIGAYAIAVVEKGNQDQIIAARRSSPMVIGIGDKEFFLASDAASIVEYTDKIVYVNDGEVVVMDRNHPLKIVTLDNQESKIDIKKLQLSISQLEKGGYPHFMLKEIFEQPKTIVDCIRGRINPETYDVILSGIMDNRERFLNARRIIFVACGADRRAPDRKYMPDPRGGGVCFGIPLPQPDHQCRRHRDRRIAVGRNGRHAGRYRAGQAERCVRLWHLQRDRLVDRPGYRFRHLHPRRA